MKLNRDELECSRGVAWDDKQGICCVIFTEQNDGEDDLMKPYLFKVRLIFIGVRRLAKTQGITQTTIE